MSTVRPNITIDFGILLPSGELCKLTKFGSILTDKTKELFHDKATTTNIVKLLRLSKFGIILTKNGTDTFIPISDMR